MLVSGQALSVGMGVCALTSAVESRGGVVAATGRIRQPRRAVIGVVITSTRPSAEIEPANRLRSPSVTVPKWWRLELPFAPATFLTTPERRQQPFPGLGVDQDRIW